MAGAAGFSSLSALDPNSFNRLKDRARNEQSPEALRAAAQQFEGMLLQMVIKQMREAGPKGDLFNSQEQQMFQSLLDQQLAINLSQTRSLGLADAIYRQLGGERLERAQAAEGESLGGANNAAGSETTLLDPRRTLAGWMPARPPVPASGDVPPDAASGHAEPPDLARMRALLSVEPPVADDFHVGGPAQLAEGLYALIRAAEVRAGALPGYQDSPAPVEDRDVVALLAGRVTAPSPARGAYLDDMAGSERAPRMAAMTETTGALVATDDGARAPVHVQQFVDAVLPHAEAISRETGIPAAFLIAQAALETGWGRQVLTHPDGRSSHNLFNIKAGSQWDGDTVARTVREFDGQGRPYREASRFRAYDSFEASFRDYAGLITGSTRYRSVLGEADPARFAHALQQAGYATDPHYARKLTRIIDGDSLQLALASARSLS